MPEIFSFEYDFSTRKLQGTNNIIEAKPEGSRSITFLFKKSISIPYFVQVITDSLDGYKIHNKFLHSFHVTFLQNPDVKNVMFIIHKL